MHSSGENSRKHKNDSNKRGGYRKFDEASSRMREFLIKSCTERVIDHAASLATRRGNAMAWNAVPPPPPPDIGPPPSAALRLIVI